MVSSETKKMIEGRGRAWYDDPTAGLKIVPKATRLGCRVYDWWRRSIAFLDGTVIRLPVETITSEF